MPTINWNQLKEINWTELIKPEYWIEGFAGGSASTPINSQANVFFWFWLIVFSVLFTIGVVINTFFSFAPEELPFKKNAPFWANNLIWMGILGVGWFLARQLEIGLLGARFWLLIGLFWAFLISIRVVRYLFWYFPLELAYFKNLQKQKKSQTAS
jgi:magnesium-transporting ATPase (P-type)